MKVFVLLILFVAVSAKRVAPPGIGGIIAGGKLVSWSQSHLSEGGKAVLDMLRNANAPKYKTTTLQLDSVEGPTREPNGVDYYTVKIMMHPPLQTDCVHALVKMRYTDFHYLWADFHQAHLEQVHFENDEFPEGRGPLDTLRDMAPSRMSNTTAEVAVQNEERREFFFGFLSSIFQHLGHKKWGNNWTHIHVSDDANYRLIKAFYSTRHIAAMYGTDQEPVQNMYDCSVN